MKNKCLIEFRDVSLVYDLNYERVNSLKERILNFLLRRKAPVDRPEVLNALDGVTVSIRQGERVGIIGLNGSGKSTFLKAAAGILQPQFGEVVVEGNVQPLIEIGAGFNPEFSGRENIYLNGAMLGFSPQQIQEREAEIITFSELEDFIDLPVKYYSSGMAVRLAFTIATMIQPEVLLMDEMLSAGDLSFIEKAKNRIEKILNKAKILVLVSHDLGLIETLTNRCLVMEKGKVLFDGSTEKALEFYRERTMDKVERARLEIQKAEEEARRLEEEKRAAEGLGPIEEVGVGIEQPTIEIVSNDGKIEPDSTVIFKVKANLTKKFTELFVNIHVYDRFGTICLHFRNDFQGLRLTDPETGEYQFTISVPKFPLKSGAYTVDTRVVGKDSEAIFFVDSPKLSFEITKGKVKNTLVENNWTSGGPTTFVRDEELK